MTEQLYSPTELVEENDFRNAWVKQLRNCMRDGLIIVANSKAEIPVRTRDINSVIVLTGNAINQIIAKELHEQFPTKGLHLEEYIKTFSYKYMQRHASLPTEKQFKYLYIERLAEYPDSSGAGVINQIDRLHDNLRTNGINRQTQMITWIPTEDLPVTTPKEHDPPCLQRIWIRVLEEPRYEYRDGGLTIKYVFKGSVEIHLMWRSRDLYAAWMSNIIAVIHMIIEYILKNEYEIIKIVDFCNAAHVYEHDFDAANKVKLMPQILR